MIWPPAEFRFEKMRILKLVRQPTNQLSISKLTECKIEFFFFSPPVPRPSIKNKLQTFMNWSIALGDSFRKMI